MTQIDKDTLNKVAKLNDDDFKALLKKVAVSNGIGNTYMDIILKNSTKVKRKLEQLNEKDFKALVDKFGEDKIFAALEQLKKG